MYKPGEIAAQIDAEIRHLPIQNTRSMRKVLRLWSTRLKDQAGDFILQTASVLLSTYGYRWLAYELIANHKSAFASIDDAKLEAFGHGIDSWWTVDSFARTLAGPAWLKGQISDDLVMRWVRSADLWWRRTAAVSTVALNLRSKGGRGDSHHTLAICRELADDPERMVAQALSWALRELIIHDASAVENFPQDCESKLDARVKHEVRSKLSTGLKNPKSKGYA